jgi:hypothetical protein
MGDKLSFLGPKAFIGRKPSRNTDVKLNQKPIVGIHNNFTPEARQPNNRENKLAFTSESHAIKIKDSQDDSNESASPTITQKNMNVKLINRSQLVETSYADRQQITITIVEDGDLT